MRTGRWWVLAGTLALVSGGCCGHPGWFQAVHRSMLTVQGYYDPLIKGVGDRDNRWQEAVVAADTTLLLASALQQQWCPDASQAQQLALQAREAQKLAQEAGVKEAGAVPGPFSPKAAD
jgi:hypothetical protein